MQYSAAYGSLASYFNQSGGTNSPGRSGGAGYSSDLPQSSAFAPQRSNGDSQQLSAQSGSGGFVSAAASMSSTDKSSFATPFNQGFGGIANFQVIGSPGAVGATQAPVTGPPTVTGAPVLNSGGSSSELMMVVIILVAIAAAKFVIK